jgi:hypothetical protein
MKKLLIIACLFISFKSQSQNAYYDALFCSTLRPVDADPDKYPMITFVGAEKDIMNDFKNFLENPFSSTCPDMVRVRSIFKKIQESDQSVQFSNKLAGIGLVSLLAPIFNLSKLSGGQTDTLLYGLTIYFAEEFRKGYMQTYMKGVEKSIGEVGELQVLFPATYKKMLSFDPLRYKEFGNEMKSVFDDDLGNALEHLRDHINNPDQSRNYRFLTRTYCSYLLKQPGYPYFDMTLSIGQKLINGVHPSDIMGYLDDTYYKQDKTEYKPGDYENIGETLHFLNLVQRNLRDTTTSKNAQYANVWINFEQFAKLNQPRQQAYFLAYLYNEDVDFFDNKARRFNVNLPAMKNIKIDSLVKTKLLPAAFHAIKTDKATSLLSILTKIDELTKLKDKSLLEEQNFDLYLKNIVELIKLTASISNAIDSDNQAKIARSVTIATNVFHTYNAVRVKNYSNILLYIENIINEITPQKIDPSAFDLVKQNFICELIKYESEMDKSKKIDPEIIYDTITKRMTYNDIRLFKKFKGSDTIVYQEIRNFALGKSTSTAGIEKTIDKKILEIFTDSTLNQIIKSIDGFSSFAAGIINAKTSEDINKVIKTYADPPASFIDKRTKGFRVTLGGMPGIYIAGEKLDRRGKPVSSTGKLEKAKTNIGLSLPIGLDFSWAILSNKKGKNSSFGVFAQVIDLGAMLNYRLKTSASTLPNKVGWEAVLSPGVSFSFGIPQCPWTIQLGYQRGPALRRVVDANANDNLVPSDRIQLRLAYDIPLLKIVGGR